MISIKAPSRQRKDTAGNPGESARMQPIEALAKWQSWDLGKEFPRWKEKLRDGTEVLVRPLGPDDAARERVLLEALSPQTRRYRFLGAMGHPTPELIHQLTHPLAPREIAFAAVADVGGSETILGIGRYATGTDSNECECAVVVRDDWQHRGVATLLMTHLIQVAKARGIKRMWSMDAVANERMAELADFLGFRRDPDPGDATQVIHSLWLG
jgi:GNAT superfamily N-acetyltransferase